MLRLAVVLADGRLVMAGLSLLGHQRQLRRLLIILIYKVYRQEQRNAGGGSNGGVEPYGSAPRALADALQHAVVQVVGHGRQLGRLLPQGLAQVQVLLAQYVVLVLVHDCSILMILQSFFLVRLRRDATVVGSDSVM